MDKALIATYSPKYKAYQRKIRTHQIERAEKTLHPLTENVKGKPTDPIRFVKKTSVTQNGKIAEKHFYNLNEKTNAKRRDV